MSTLSTYDSTVNSFYLAFYGRPADPAGLKYWSQQLANNNGDFSSIVDAFANSEEALTRFGSASTADRITDIYSQLFNRTPDTDGMAYWMNAINKGQASMADVALSILRGARGSDATLSQLRQQAADAFTAEVEASGAQYDGYASIEAARVLVRAVTPNATQADLDTLVKSAVSFADTATKTPKVVEAIAVNTTLLALFDTARGTGDPVALAQALSDTAKAAAGDPVTLESLLRGGGMDKVLKVMPVAATLKDVVAALGKGGLPAAVEVVYPTAPVETPEPPKHVDGPIGVVPKPTFFVMPSEKGLQIATNVEGTLRLIDGKDAAVLKAVAIDPMDGLLISSIGAQENVVKGTLEFTPKGGSAVAAPNAAGIVISLGTDREDNMSGSVVWGFDGNDTITGTAGDDNLFGGNGNDTISGGTGRDVIHGGVGADLIDLGVDEVADRIIYEKGDAAGLAFVDGSSTEAIDKISNFGLNDVLEVNHLIGQSSVVANDYLVSNSSSNYAIIRGSDADGKFVKGSGVIDDDYLVQWKNGDTVNSIILHNYGVLEPMMVVSEFGNTITFQHMPQPPQPQPQPQPFIAKYLQTNVTLSSNPNTAVIVSSDGPTMTMSDPAGVSLYDFSTGSAVAFAGNGAPVTMNNTVLYFSQSLKPDLYKMSWGAGTFATTNGVMEAAEVLFAGGSDGQFAYRGFELSRQVIVHDSITRANSESVNEAFISDGKTDASITTGGGNDVVVDNGSKLKIVYDKFDSSAHDLVLGFDKGDDVISFNGDAASLLDRANPGKIDWAISGESIVATTEGAHVMVKNPMPLGPGTHMGTVAGTLNTAMNVNAIAKGDYLLILAEANVGAASALLVYQNIHENGVIDHDELTTIAMFGDAVPDLRDIVLVGIPQESGSVL